MHLIDFVVVAAVTISSAVTLTPLAVQFLVSLVIPVGTGLATRSNASASVKQAVTVILSGISGVIVTATTTSGVAIISVETFVVAAIGWAIAIASYNGVYEPHHLNEHTAPNVGIGGHAGDARSFEKG